MLAMMHMDIIALLMLIGRVDMTNGTDKRVIRIIGMGQSHQCGRCLGTGLWLIGGEPPLTKCIAYIDDCRGCRGTGVCYGRKSQDGTCWACGMGIDNG